MDMHMAKARVQSTVSNFKWLLRFLCTHAQPCGGTHADLRRHFDIDSAISQLLDGPRSYSSEGGVYGYGKGTCSKHSS